jgi:4-amino-4-deoxy-L-arabinose transferase-like glycosyltransferase
MRIAGGISLVVGCGLIAIGQVTVFKLVVRLFSSAGIVEYPVLESLRAGRAVAFGLGALVCALSGFLLVFPRLARDWASWLGARIHRVTDSPRTVWLVLLGIVLIGLAVRAYFYVGLVRTDSFWTTASAHSLIKGDRFFEYSTYYGRSRRILIYGTWLVFSIFGESELATTLLPLACSLGTIVLLFFIGRKLWSSRAGLIAAAIYALAAPDIALSSFLLPDPMMPFFLSAAMLLFLKGRDPHRPWTKRGLFFGAGGVTALTFLVRENGPIAVGVFLLYWILFDRRRWRDYAVGALGFGLILALILYGVRDDLSLYFGKMFVDSTDAGAADVVRTYRHLGFLRILASDPLYFPLYWPILVSFLAGIRAAWRRRRDVFNGIGLVVVWFGWLYVYLDFLGRYVHGFGNIPRYTSILLPPAVLLLAWAIERLRNQAWVRTRRLVRAATYLLLLGYLVFVLTSGYELLQRAQTQHRMVNYYWEAPAQWLRNLEFRSIYFLGENTWDKKMSFFLHYTWPDVPYYVQTTGGESVYPGVKPEYLGKVEALQEEFREWRRRYVMDDPGELASLGPEIYKIEDAYVLVNPNTLVTMGLDYLIPDDWQVLERFQECRNWRERDRILYYAPERDTLPDSDAWVADALRSVERGDLEQALRRLRFAVMLDPENQAARQLHESVRLRLLSEGGGSDELNVALLQAGTWIEGTEGELVNPLYNVAQALTLPRENRWVPQHYCYFDGKNELPIAVTLEFGQPRTIHNLEIRWRDYPSYVGSAWEAYGDRGDGSWSLIGRVHVEEDRLYELGLREATEFTRIKLLVTAIGEAQRSAGIRIERIIIH